MDDIQQSVGQRHDRYIRYRLGFTLCKCRPRVKCCMLQIMIDNKQERVEYGCGYYYDRLMFITIIINMFYYNNVSNNINPSQNIINIGRQNVPIYNNKFSCSSIDANTLMQPGVCMVTHEAYWKLPASFQKRTVSLICDKIVLR